MQNSATCLKGESYHLSDVLMKISKFQLKHQEALSSSQSSYILYPQSYSSLQGQASIVSRLTNYQLSPQSNSLPPNSTPSSLHYICI